MQQSAKFSRLRAATAMFNQSLFISHKNFYFALMETLIFLSAMVLLNVVFGDGNRFITMGLHPFWIIVLLVTLQYGPKEALVAALLSSFFLLVGNLPEQNLTETMYGYLLRVTFLPFLWIVTALVLGGLRSRQMVEKQHLMERLSNSEEANNATVKAYNSLKQAKERLELRLAEEKRSVLTVYNIAKSLEILDPADALTEVSKLVKAAFNARQFSLYRCDGEGLRLEVAQGWETPNAYVSQFNPASALARNILEKKCVLSIINEEDELLLDGQGILAGPIFDVKTGKIFGMLKIEDIAFMDMGIRTHETFRIVCEWIGHVYANVERYQSMHNRSIQIQPSRNQEVKLMPAGDMPPYPILVPVSIAV